MKITFLQVHEAFGRALFGESVRAIAQSMGVTEGCIRYHFRKGSSPKAVRKLAFDLFYARQVRERLTQNERAMLDRQLNKPNPDRLATD